MVDTVAYVSVSRVPWFLGCRIRNGENGIHFLLNRDGRRRGDALIELESKADVQKALEKNLRYMGPRYVKGELETEVELKETVEWIRTAWIPRQACAGETIRDKTSEKKCHEVKASWAGQRKAKHLVTWGATLGGPLIAWGGMGMKVHAWRKMLL